MDKTFDRISSFFFLVYNSKCLFLICKNTFAVKNPFLFSFILSFYLCITQFWYFILFDDMNLMISSFLLFFFLIFQSFFWPCQVSFLICKINTFDVSNDWSNTDPLSSWSVFHQKWKYGCNDDQFVILLFVSFVSYSNRDSSSLSMRDSTTSWTSAFIGAMEKILKSLSANCVLSSQIYFGVSEFWMNFSFVSNSGAHQMDLYPKENESKSKIFLVVSSSLSYFYFLTFLLKIQALYTSLWNFFIFSLISDFFSSIACPCQFD